ncbi:DUF3574 domain-containing protein [Nevskia sp.]|uniref:DUF3574 domain-containing protein n=1 Tax=Nevskia sp. TaxID=1929292 RepID=UPI0025FC1DEA|nr:DUF3574 domain-containing protein [Nevskia sp.]
MSRTLLAAVLLATSLLLPVSHAAEAPVKATMQGDAARPAKAPRWQRAELYFGLGRSDGSTADADRERWQRFLDEEVTTRFPDGFSVLDVYGQWQRRDTKTIERLNSKLLVILFQGPQHRRDLDALRAAWKQRSGDESVLLTISPAEVSF